MRDEDSKKEEKVKMPSNDFRKVSSKKEEVKKEVSPIRKVTLNKKDDSLPEKKSPSKNSKRAKRNRS
jgi:hypothetical protein